MTSDLDILVSADPVLRQCKLVTWPRNSALLPRQGVRGFPHQAVLLQHNAGFSKILSWLQHGGSYGLESVAGQLTGALPFDLHTLRVSGVQEPSRVKRQCSSFHGRFHRCLDSLLHADVERCRCT